MAAVGEKDAAGQRGDEGRRMAAAFGRVVRKKKGGNGQASESRSKGGGGEAARSEQQGPMRKVRKMAAPRWGGEPSGKQRRQWPRDSDGGCGRWTTTVGVGGEEGRNRGGQRQWQGREEDGRGGCVKMATGKRGMVAGRGDQGYGRDRRPLVVRYRGLAARWQGRQMEISRGGAEDDDNDDGKGGSEESQ
ncbi:hypothetical protein GW17_00020630 [Ensete ventricosum]|nr:hypothetical protein GW17_00020630 [Ensete ventricosum]